MSSSCSSVQDSLAAEIEGTMRKELQMDDPDVEEQRYTTVNLLHLENEALSKRTLETAVPFSPDCSQSACSRQWKTST